MGGEEDEPEGGDGHGVMMEVMIGVPMVGEFVEALVFDLPASVSIENGDPGGGSQCLRQSGRPPPVGDLLRIDPFAGNAFALLGCFQGADHAKTFLIPIGAEAFEIPSFQSLFGNWGSGCIFLQKGLERRCYRVGSQKD